MKKLLMILVLATTLFSCSTDDSDLTDNGNGGNDNPPNTTKYYNFEFYSTCNVSRTLIVNGVETVYNLPLGESMVWNVPLQSGDRVFMKLRVNGCNSNTPSNRISISQFNNNGGSIILREQSCSCNLLVTDEVFIVP